MRVSVIVPTYNRRRWLPHALASALAQSHRPFEVLVIDDGSTDGTADLLRNLPPPVRWVRQENAGDAAARNRGLALAQGDLIAFLDDDDLWRHDKLARQIELFEARPEAGLAFSPKRIIDEQGQVIGRQWKPLAQGWVTEALFASIFIPTSSVVIRRELTCRLGGFDTSLRVGSDYEYWLRASLETQFAAVPEPLVDFRRSGRSLSGSRPAEGAVTLYRALERFYNERSGQRAIRPRVARRRLGELAYEAGRALVKSGDRGRAREFFAVSLAWRPTLRARWATLQPA